MTPVLVAVFAALSVWLPYHREQEVIQKIKSWGGEVLTKRGAPVWLRRLVDDEQMPVFDRVKSVQLDFTKITDADLIQLGGLTRLERLNLNGTDVTDAGLHHLGGLTNLEVLRLALSKVGDAGLPSLCGLKKLKYLDLRVTQVTDEGVAVLQKALPDCKIRH